MTMGDTQVESLGDDMYKVRVDIRNERVIPTITARAMATKAVRPDVLSAEGDVEIVAAGWVVNKHQPGKTKLIDQKELDRILVRSGHPGRTTRTVEYVVRGTGNLNVTYSTVKGGTVSTTVRVR
jgi:hypothetical protein